MTYQVNFPEATAFLQNIIKEQANEKELEWINLQEEKLQKKFSLRSFYLAFSSAPRFIKKDSVELDQEQLAKAQALREGFQPENWNLVKCVRIYFLLMLPHEDADTYDQNITRLFETADMDEQVALYSSLPLLPFPEVLSKRAAEGIRTNITDVFDAIALNNPYPKDYLKQDAWNQMLLKAVFMQRPLYRIYGADERANPELARMLVDFAHERWAANREVLPELWRFVAPFLENGYFPDIKRTVGGKPLERKAGLLACASSGLPEAQQLLDLYPEVKKEIKSGRLNWTLIGRENESTNESS